MLRSFAMGLTLLTLCIASACAEPLKLQWWHAMSGQLGDALEQVVARFNAAQNTYQVVAVHKGNYVATLNAAIAAYRAGQPPHLLQNNESGVLTMLLSGAIVPVHEILEQHGVQVEGVSA
jgi:sn-glycerol 3-phosphate transport system substrate-binding protein